MGVNRYEDEDDSVSRGTLDSPPPRSKKRSVPAGDLATTISMVGEEGYGNGEDAGVGGSMGEDPSIRALQAAAKLLAAAQELNSILPLPQELLGMLDMIRVGLPQQLEQLEASRAMLGMQSGPADPAAQFQLMGAQPQMAPAPSPMAGPAAPGAGPGGQAPMMPGMPMI